jgi:hypothetical protein
MKKLSILFGVLILISSAIKAQDCKGTNKEERRVLNLVNSLPEVVRENQVRKRGSVKSFLRAYIQNTPTKTSDYYSVSISEEKGGRLFTYDWYEVNPHTYVIRYWDIANTGKTMSLKEWRKQLRRSKKT